MLKKEMKRKRLENGLTIQELSEVTGISLSSISMYESGKRIPSIKNIDKISKALNIESRQLFDETHNIMQNKEDNIEIQKAFIRANGKCELCGQNAPFITEEGEPYLVEKGIYYDAENRKYIFAVCPNCHAKLSILPCKGEKIYLLKCAKQKSLD